MKLIPLTQGKFAKVDDEDFEWLSQWKWYFDHGYAARKNRGEKKIYLHRLILQFPDGRSTDHADGDRLNNCRENLRDCSQHENSGNSNLHKDSSSGYKGVSFDKRRKKWEAYITDNYKKKHIGFFDFPEIAARAYDEAAIKYFGEFARLNFGEKNQQEESCQLTHF